jgi:hypothetical protein
MQALMPRAGYSVVVVRPEHVASTRSRIGESPRVLVVSEAELLQVQHSFLQRTPDVLVMHADLAATSRGATMISALKAAGMDGGAAIRVFIEDDGMTPMLLATETNLAPEDIVLETSRPLDRAGTRQASRFPMHRRTIAVNGEAAQLVDLSVSGAQVQAGIRLHPLKVARLVVPGDSGDLRMQGTIAWATGVPAGGTIQYRAGIEFVKPDKQLLAAFCEKHGDAPDPLLGGLEQRRA